MRYADRVNRPREGLKMGFDFGHADGVLSLKGTYIIELTDADTGAAPGTVTVWTGGSPQQTWG